MTEDLEEYISAHCDAEPENLHLLERRSWLCTTYGHMCSGHVQGRLLKMLVRMARPERILELGTFTGYSALCLAEALPPEGRVDTIEVEDEHEDLIREALTASPHGSKVRLIIGDALEVMSAMESETYDMIFIDANKRHYCDYYEEAMRLLRPGGFIMADNTLWDGHVAGERHDAQTEGIRRFNDLVAADPRVEKVIVPIRDGLTLIYKI